MIKIHSEKELQFYIAADMMMNHGKFKWTWKDRLKHIVAPDYIMRYLKSLRNIQYLSDHKGKNPLRVCRYAYHRMRCRKLGYKLGFIIFPDVLGYGVNIPHYGPVIVASHVGNYACLHTMINVIGRKSVIGDGAYLCTGAKVVSPVKVGDNVTFAANCVVNKDVPGNSMVAGVPARVMKPAIPWYVKEDPKFTEWHNAVEALKASPEYAGLIQQDRT